MKLIKRKLLYYVVSAFLTTVSFSLFAYNPYDCLDDISEVDSEITVGLATELCSAAWSPEPIKCYLGVSLIDKEMPRGLAIELCAGSVNFENTLECYSKSGNRELNRGLAITLCGANKLEN